MKSRFDSSRIFNDLDGWHVVMRACDRKIISSAKFRLIANQHVMGPFPTKPDVEDWLEGYLAVHSQNRETPYLNDNIAQSA